MNVPQDPRKISLSQSDAVFGEGPPQTLDHDETIDLAALKRVQKFRIVAE